jgi:hypothetical protein
MYRCKVILEDLSHLSIEVSTAEEAEEAVVREEVKDPEMMYALSPSSIQDKSP